MPQDDAPPGEPAGYWKPSAPRLSVPPQLPAASQADPPEPRPQPPGPRRPPVHLPPAAGGRNGPIEREYKDISNPTVGKPYRAPGVNR